VSCLTYIINLVNQDFFSTVELEATNNNVVVQLEDKQVQDVARSTGLSTIVKKIFDFVIMQRDNICANFIKFAFL